MSIILIVDDVAENISVLGSGLKGEYDIRFATRGEDALKATETGEISLILLDIDMPGMDGYDVCRRLKSQKSTQDIPVIFLTALDRVEDEALGLNLGAVDYITKPFNLPIVKARIKTHLELKARQDAMRSFMQIASHDLKNPLTAILLSTMLIERSPGQTPKHLSAINDAVLRAKNLIETYLLASTVSDAPIQVERETLKVQAVVQTELDFISSLVNAQQALTFRNLVADDEINADPLKLRQILSNLVSNAAKYSPAGGEVSVHMQRIERDALFTVSDQGVGITSDERARLFEKFERVGQKGLSPGTGLGLWLTRVLIQAQGGRIWVESEPGAGSTFYFTIPQT